MSNDYVVTSKQVRAEFTAELLHDDSPENPREWGTQVTAIYIWDDEHMVLSLKLGEATEPLLVLVGDGRRGSCLFVQNSDFLCK